MRGDASPAGGASEPARCRSLLDDWRSGPTPWCVTWGVLYECLHLVTHRRVFQRPFAVADAWRFAEALLVSPALPNLEVVDPVSV